MNENIVVVSKIKEIVKQNSKSMGSDVPEKLSEKVHQIIKEGIQRANENGRQTLMGRDL